MAVEVRPKRCGGAKVKGKRRKGVTVYLDDDVAIVCGGLSSANLSWLVNYGLRELVGPQVGRIQEAIAMAKVAAKLPREGSKRGVELADRRGPVAKNGPKSAILRQEGAA